jgi:hypothetical protein
MMSQKILEHNLALLIQSAESRSDFHLNIAPIIKRQVKRFISVKSIGYQTDVNGKMTYDIDECEVEWITGATTTVWRAWDVNVPLCYEDRFDFRFGKPSIDVYRETDR